MGFAGRKKARGKIERLQKNNNPGYDCVRFATL
jgi:hypothetical protein